MTTVPLATSSRPFLQLQPFTSQIQQPYRGLSTLLLGRPAVVENPGGILQSPSPTFLTPVRTHIRIHFPRAKESIRVRRHGWKKRMETPAGRKIIMRRILKGRYILSH